MNIHFYILLKSAFNIVHTHQTVSKQASKIYIYKEYYTIIKINCYDTTKRHNVKHQQHFFYIL